MEAKLKYLEMIQAVITRMAHNSFLLKGWSVTLTAAIFALSAKDANPNFVIIALLPTSVFWGLDGYFLRQERLFRKLYDSARNQPPKDIDFSMNTQPYQNEVDSWFGVVVSTTLLAFHLPIVALVAGVSIYLIFP